MPGDRSTLQICLLIHSVSPLSTSVVAAVVAAVWRSGEAWLLQLRLRRPELAGGKLSHLLPCSALPAAGATPQRKYTPASCLQKPPRPRLRGTCGKDLPVPRLARGWQCRRDHCWEVRPVASWREGRPGPELVLPLQPGWKAT